jgi:hypothetical protein
VSGAIATPPFPTTEGSLSHKLEIRLDAVFEAWSPRNCVPCKSLGSEIRKNVAKALHRDMMYDLFNRLQNKRTRVIGERQISIRKTLLEADEMDFSNLVIRIQGAYAVRITEAEFFRKIREMPKGKAYPFLP